MSEGREDSRNINFDERSPILFFPEDQKSISNVTIALVVKIGFSVPISWEYTGNISKVTQRIKRNDYFLEGFFWNIENEGKVNWQPSKDLYSGGGYQIVITDPVSGVFAESPMFSIEK